MSAEGVKAEVGLFYEDNEHVQTTLKNLNTLRKNKHFCDVVLQIGTHEIHAHRAVLACASPYLFNLFTVDGEANHESRYKLNGGFEKDAFERLVNYAYTSRLEIPHGQVKTVYLAATRLKMERVAHKCGEYLVRNLKPENSIGIRSIPGLANDADLVAVVDNYIEQEVDDVMKSKELHALQRVQVEVLRSSKEEMEVVNCNQLCTMVLDWIRFCVEEDELNIESLTEKVYMLYVNKEHALHDCTNVQPDDLHDSELVQDYKKMSRIYQAPGGKNRKKAVTAPIPAKPRQLLYSRSTSDSSINSDNGQEFQWKMIACKNTAEHSFMSIVVIGGCLYSLSVAQRLNKPNKIMDCLPKPVLDKKPDDYLLLPPMSSPRCAVGTAERDGKLLVCGGYDRGECLKTVQEYDPRTNIWNIMASMRHSRGRFDITVVDGKAFAVGGCDGSHELSSVECFDPDTQKWKYMSPLAVARSNAGVCTLGGKVYCIGGWNGLSGTKRCDVFDPATGEWTECGSLLVGRYQAAVCVFKGLVYAVGGCDSWNCFNSVEKYDPVTNVWEFATPMTISRRGGGAAELNGKLYVVGGSDGSRALCSVEIFDPESGAWSSGPNLTSCRANVGVAVVDNKLYAVGGYTGKTFLNTVEFLDPQTNEWTTFTPRLKSIENGENGHS